MMSMMPPTSRTPSPLRLAAPRPLAVVASTTKKDQRGSQPASKRLDELRARRKEAEAKRVSQLRKIAQKIDEVCRDEVSNLTNSFANSKKGAMHHDGSIDIDFESASDSDD
jgi:hypothetical protein